MPKIARERITAWLDERGHHPRPLWLGQRGPTTISGVVHVVLAVGEAAGQAGLRPHRCRHTCATRLRQGDADPAQVQALLGLAPLPVTSAPVRANKLRPSSASSSSPSRSLVSPGLPPPKVSRRSAVAPQNRPVAARSTASPWPART
ncbi:tyrosine-type recombinase/integrase [Streptosporangium sp. NPDC049376]|uniref:tyrosine-type recombinase/integrase n=1 Tax=Streptosporangium sp. NPDC049376 TaxID=3366192 RepID=UPI0037A7C12A